MNRRRFLKNGIVASSSLAAVSGITAAGGDKIVGLNTDFNPKKPAETRRFVGATFETSEQLSNEQLERIRPKVIGRLSKEQIQAVTEVLQSIPVYHKCQSLAQNDPSHEEVTTQGYRSYSYTISCYVNPPVTGEKHAYDYTHTIHWAYDGTSISEPEADATGTGYKYLLVKWDYTGSTVDDINNAGNHFTSEKTGSFENCITYSFDTICDTDLASSKLIGDANGYGSVIDSSCNG